MQTPQKLALRELGCPSRDLTAKVRQVREVLPQCSEEEACQALFDADEDVTRATEILMANAFGASSEHGAGGSSSAGKPPFKVVEKLLAADSLPLPSGRPGPAATARAARAAEKEGAAAPGVETADAAAGSSNKSSPSNARQAHRQRLKNNPPQERAPEPPEASPEASPLTPSRQPPASTSPSVAEKELLKLRKKLREMDRIEQRSQAGEKVDPLQLAKLDRKTEVVADVARNEAIVAEEEQRRARFLNSRGGWNKKAERQQQQAAAAAARAASGAAPTPVVVAEKATPLVARAAPKPLSSASSEENGSTQEVEADVEVEEVDEEQQSHGIALPPGSQVDVTLAFGSFSSDDLDEHREEGEPALIGESAPQEEPGGSSPLQAGTEATPTPGSAPDKQKENPPQIAETSVAGQSLQPNLEPLSPQAQMLQMQLAMHAQMAYQAQLAHNAQLAQGRICAMQQGLAMMQTGMHHPQAGQAGPHNLVGGGHMVDGSQNPHNNVPHGGQIAHGDTQGNFPSNMVDMSVDGMGVANAGMMGDPAAYNNHCWANTYNNGHGWEAEYASTSATYSPTSAVFSPPSIATTGNGSSVDGAECVYPPMYVEEHMNEHMNAQQWWGPCQDNNLVNHGGPIQETSTGENHGNDCYAQENSNHGHEGLHDQNGQGANASGYGRVVPPHEAGFNTNFRADYQKPFPGGISGDYGKGYGKGRGAGWNSYTNRNRGGENYHPDEYPQNGGDARGGNSDQRGSGDYGDGDFRGDSRGVGGEYRGESHYNRSGDSSYQSSESFPGEYRNDHRNDYNRDVRSSENSRNNGGRRGDYSGARGDHGSQSQSNSELRELRDTHRETYTSGAHRETSTSTSNYYRGEYDRSSYRGKHRDNHRAQHPAGEGRYVEPPASYRNQGRLNDADRDTSSSNTHSGRHFSKTSQFMHNADRAAGGVGGPRSQPTGECSPTPTVVKPRAADQEVKAVLVRPSAVPVKHAVLVKPKTAVLVKPRVDIKTSRSAEDPEGKQQTVTVQQNAAGAEAAAGTSDTWPRLVKPPLKPPQPTSSRPVRA